MNDLEFGCPQPLILYGQNTYKSTSELNYRFPITVCYHSQSWGQFVFINSEFHFNSFLSILESIPIPLVLRKVNSNSIPIPKKSIPYQFHPRMRLLLSLCQKCTVQNHRVPKRPCAKMTLCQNDRGSTSRRQSGMFQTVWIPHKTAV